VTSFLINENSILLLKRSSKVSSYKGKWAGISGSIEKGESPIDAAKREIFEETGILPTDIVLLEKGHNFKIPYKDFEWVVHPILFNSKIREVILNWENEDYGWFERGEMSGLDTVPLLLDSLDILLKKNRQNDRK